MPAHTTRLAALAGLTAVGALAGYGITGVANAGERPAAPSDTSVGTAADTGPAVPVPAVDERAAAVGYLSDAGFDAVTPADYLPGRHLNVLVGTVHDAADGTHGQ